MDTFKSISNMVEALTRVARTTQETENGYCMRIHRDKSPGQFYCSTQQKRFVVTNKRYSIVMVTCNRTELRNKARKDSRKL